MEKEYWERKIRVIDQNVPSNAFQDMYAILRLLLMFLIDWRFEKVEE